MGAGFSMLWCLQHSFLSPWEMWHGISRDGEGGLRASYSGGSYALSIDNPSAF